MPRPAKKADDKAKVPVVAAPLPTMVPPPAPAGAIPPSPAPAGPHMAMPTRVVDIDSFLIVRDSVSSRFPHLHPLLPASIPGALLVHSP